jgi:hypothetical protein
MNVGKEIILPRDRRDLEHAGRLHEAGEFPEPIEA